MCPYTLVHNKMLASTMQHSTHNHTPATFDHHHTHHQGDALGDPGQEPKKHPIPGVSSGPNSVPSNHEPDSCVPPSATPHPLRTGMTCSKIRRTTLNTSSHGQPHQHGGLLRKEVIQPHLPVRLPCYDFVPIAGPTFDDSLPQGVRPSASGVTNFHDVTGGVYKARERIHRSVADLRLLATPTSRGRVADPDPN
jgi:hypothetical protein